MNDPPPPMALGRCIDHLDQLVCGIGVWIQVVLVDNLSFVFVVLFVSQLGGCDSAGVMRSLGCGLIAPG